MSPRRLLPPPPARQSASPPAWLELDASERILTEAACEALIRRIEAMTQGGGTTTVQMESWWQGELRWARNRVSLASDRRDLSLSIYRGIEGGGGSVATNQLDPVSLEAAVRAAERGARQAQARSVPGYLPPVPPLPLPKTAVWSEATYNESTEARGALVRSLIEPAEAKGMLSAGYLELRAQSTRKWTNSLGSGFAGQQLDFDKQGRWQGVPSPPLPYTMATMAQCQMTVRDPEGTGSGWAGRSSYDWATIEHDLAEVGARALDKCLASRHPVALEPGHYTVILEPQFADLVFRGFMSIMSNVVPFLDRVYPEESGGGPLYQEDDPVLRVHKAKLGKKLFDARLTFSYDPADPELGILPQNGHVQPITYIKNGVLTELGYGRNNALQRMHTNLPGQYFPWAYRVQVDGATASIGEMIATTKRGLLVTNSVGGFSRSGPGAGTTRDGLWLIEDGKITKPVKNMAWADDYFRVLNSIDQLGVPQPVFAPYAVTDYAMITPTPSFVPPMKIHDFNFTRLVDAV